MTIAEAEIRLNEEMEYARGLLSDIPDIIYSCEVERTVYNDGEGEEDVVFLFGSVRLSAEGFDEEQSIYIALETEIDALDTVNEEAFERDKNVFRERLEKISGRLRAAESAPEELLILGAEIDKAHEKEYERRMKELEGATQDRLKTAIIATAVMAVLAVLCILIDKLV